MVASLRRYLPGKLRWACINPSHEWPQWRIQKPPPVGGGLKETRCCNLDHSFVGQVRSESGHTKVQIARPELVIESANLS
jgi:hypothetical protein